MSVIWPGFIPRTGTVGIAFSWFEIGCPVCTRLIILALGASGALVTLVTLQPWLAMPSVAIPLALILVRVLALSAGARPSQDPTPHDRATSRRSGRPLAPRRPLGGHERSRPLACEADERRLSSPPTAIVWYRAMPIAVSGEMDGDRPGRRPGATRIDREGFHA